VNFVQLLQSGGIAGESRSHKMNL